MAQLFEYGLNQRWAQGSALLNEIGHLDTQRLVVRFRAPNRFQVSLRLLTEASHPPVGTFLGLRLADTLVSLKLLRRPLSFIHRGVNIRGHRSFLGILRAFGLHTQLKKFFNAIVIVR